MPRNLTQHVCSNGRGRLAAAILFCVAVTACPAAASQMTVEQTVLVYDAAQVAPELLLKARNDVVRIFREAGIQLRWLNCLPSPGECPEVLDHTMLVLRIAAVRGALDDGESTGLAVLAPEGGVRFYVFYDAVERIATPNVKAPVILAHAIAHEIGHLLLRLRGHTPTGLMHGRWGAQELHKAVMGSLVFSTEQAAKMRAEVQRRADASQTAKAL